MLASLKSAGQHEASNESVKWIRPKELNPLYHKLGQLVLYFMLFSKLQLWGSLVTNERIHTIVQVTRCVFREVHMPVRMHACSHKFDNCEPVSDYVANFVVFCGIHGVVGVYVVRWSRSPESTQLSLASLSEFMTYSKNALHNQIHLGTCKQVQL